MDSNITTESRYPKSNICDLFQNQQLFHQEIAQLFETETIVEAWIIEDVRDYNFCLIDVFARGPPIS